jgi:hypothetical protein
VCRLLEVKAMQTLGSLKASRSNEATSYPRRRQPSHKVTDVKLKMYNSDTKKETAKCQLTLAASIFIIVHFYNFVPYCSV